MKKSVLIISISPIHRDPRVLRQIQFLKEKYKLTVAGLTDPCINGVKFIEISQKTSKTLVRKVFELFLVWLSLTKFLFWQQKQIQELKRTLLFVKEPFDLIIANDAETLPLSVFFKERWDSKLLVDLHEYAPRQFSNNLLWKIRYGKYFFQILQKYLGQADSVITVCQGIADEVLNEFGIKAAILTNAPAYQNLLPSQIDTDRIQIIHHGGASRARKLETMIEMMKYLDPRYYLNFILIGDPRYISELQTLAKSDSRIRFLPSVPTHQISSFINQFDIGLYILEPTNFNNRIALPNKFFEFIQARLCIAIGPSQEMLKITKEFDLGVVADDFSPESLAAKIQGLTPDEISNFKKNSNLAAKELSAEKNRALLLQIVEGMVGN